MNRLISLLAAVLITAAALVFALWDADFAVLWQTLLSGRHWVLLPFLAVLGIFFLSNAIRWTLLLDPFGCFSARQVLPSMMIGFAANNLLPLRIGELIRAYLFAREFRIARSGVLMTLVLERVLDLVAILAIYALGLLLLPDAPAAMRAGLWLATLGIGAIAAAVLAFAVMPQRIDRLWLSVSASMSQAVQARGSTYLEQFAKALAPLLVPTTLLALLAESILRWLLAGVLAWLCVYAFREAIAPELALVVIGVTAVAVSLPSVPGFVGPIQAAFVFALTPFGISTETALAASILFLLGHWVPVTLAGTVMLAAQHLSLGRLEREISVSD